MHPFAPRLTLGLTLILGMVAMTTTVVSSQARPQAQPQYLAQTNTTNLVNHLNRTGAKMYGAYWCKFCKKQKELLGAAASQVNYIECDPTGQNAKPSLCQQAKIQAYPTWEINGKLYPGMLTLQQLAQLSGYKGSL